MDLDRVLNFLSDCRSRRLATVLVTVCAVEGSSMRNPGTIMGVAEDGTFDGSLSGGCIENAVVSEALEVLAKQEARIVRFGAGSPYLDIKLPCGGGLDVHFWPVGDGDVIEQCLGSIRAREPSSIRIGPDGVSHHEGWTRSTFEADKGQGVFGHWPAPILQIIGHGAGVEALAKQARAFGCWAKVFTPDERLMEALSAENIWAYRLGRIDQTDVLASDPWTATIFLFHDHDWEIDLMTRALELPHFYFGAMGGRKAHAFRSEALKARGVSDERLSSIRAPIGLFHSSRDPQTLALSTLAEVIRTYEETDFEHAAG